MGLSLSIELSLGGEQMISRWAGVADRKTAVGRRKVRGLRCAGGWRGWGGQGRSKAADSPGRPYER